MIKQSLIRNTTGSYTSEVHLDCDLDSFAFICACRRESQSICMYARFIRLLRWWWWWWWQRDSATEQNWNNLNVLRPFHRHTIHIIPLNHSVCPSSLHRYSFYRFINCMACSFHVSRSLDLHINVRRDAQNRAAHIKHPAGRRFIEKEI